MHRGKRDLTRWWLWIALAIAAALAVFQAACQLAIEAWRLW